MRVSASCATRHLDVSGIFVQIGLLPNGGFLADLVDTNDHVEIVVDDKCRISHANIYATGDVPDVPYKQVVAAIGEGAKAGLATIEDRMPVA